MTRADLPVGDRIWRPLIQRISSVGRSHNRYRLRASSVALGFETLRRDPTPRARRRRWQDGASFGIDGFATKKEGSWPRAKSQADAKTLG